MVVSGFCDPRFAEIESLFQDLWQGIEVGAALAIYWQGECVVDLYGGYQDRAQTIPWQPDTLVNTYSITKGVVATALALLVEEGRLDYRDLVSRHWPEFAESGKSDITVAQLLSHQAGLCGVETSLKVEDLYNWGKMTSLLCKQKPLWLPGTAAGYHAVTWGYLAGELIRQISGKTPGQFIHDRICEPLDLNFYLGVPAEKLSNCAEIIGPNHARQGKPSTATKTKETTSTIDPLFALAQQNPVISPFKHASSEAWRLAEIPASNGHGDAKSLARLYGALANRGSLPGISLLRPETIESTCEVAVDTHMDLVMGHIIRRSRGGFILSHEQNYGPGSQSFGHAGAGGSMAFADPEARLGFAYVMNQLQPSGSPYRYGEILEKIYSKI